MSAPGRAAHLWQTSPRLIREGRVVVAVVAEAPVAPKVDGVLPEARNHGEPRAAHDARFDRGTADARAGALLERVDERARLGQRRLEPLYAALLAPVRHQRGERLWVDRHFKSAG